MHDALAPVRSHEAVFDVEGVTPRGFAESGVEAVPVGGVRQVHALGPSQPGGAVLPDHAAHLLGPRDLACTQVPLPVAHAADALRLQELPLQLPPLRDVLQRAQHTDRCAVVGVADDLAACMHDALAPVRPYEAVLDVEGVAS